jgi:hypothetical protein
MIYIDFDCQLPAGNAGTCYKITVGYHLTLDCHIPYRRLFGRVVLAGWEIQHNGANDWPLSPGKFSILATEETAAAIVEVARDNGAIARAGYEKTLAAYNAGQPVTIPDDRYPGRIA